MELLFVKTGQVIYKENCSIKVTGTPIKAHYAQELYPVGCHRLPPSFLVKQLRKSIISNFEAVSSVPEK